MNVAGSFLGPRAWNTQYEIAQQNTERIEMKELIAIAVDDVKHFDTAFSVPPTKSDADKLWREANVWSRKTGYMIENAYGKGERDVFDSDAGLTLLNSVNDPTQVVRIWVGNRLQHLNNLIERADNIPLRPDFDPKTYQWPCPDCGSVP
jgi:hypothetical protein